LNNKYDNNIYKKYYIQYLYCYIYLFSFKKYLELSAQNILLKHSKVSNNPGTDADYKQVLQKAHLSAYVSDKARMSKLKDPKNSDSIGNKYDIIDNVVNLLQGNDLGQNAIELTFSVLDNEKVNSAIGDYVNSVYTRFQINDFTKTLLTHDNMREAYSSVIDDSMGVKKLLNQRVWGSAASTTDKNVPLYRYVRYVPNGRKRKVVQVTSQLEDFITNNELKINVSTTAGDHFISANDYLEVEKELESVRKRMQGKAEEGVNLTYIDQKKVDNYLHV